MVDQGELWKLRNHSRSKGCELRPDRGDKFREERGPNSKVNCRIGTAVLKLRASGPGHEEKESRAADQRLRVQSVGAEDQGWRVREIQSRACKADLCRPQANQSKVEGCNMEACCGAVRRIQFNGVKLNPGHY